MRDNTFKMIELSLNGDDSLSQEIKLAILGFCKNPTAKSSSTPTSQSVNYLTPKQVAEKLGVCLRSVQRWISTEQIPSKKLGECRRVPSYALDDLSNLETKKPHLKLSRMPKVIKQSRGHISTTALHLKQDELEKVS